MYEEYVYSSDTVLPEDKEGQLPLFMTQEDLDDYAADAGLETWDEWGDWADAEVAFEDRHSGARGRYLKCLRLVKPDESKQ